MINSIRRIASGCRGRIGRVPSAAALLACTLAVTGSTASAQERRDYVVEQFEPLPNQGTNILNIGKSEVIRHLMPSFGLVFHFQDDPYQLVFESNEEEIHQRILDYVVKAEVWAAIGLFDYLDIGLVMPVILSQKTGDPEDPSPGAPQFASISSFTTSDLRIVPKLKILDSKDFDGFGLAFLMPISLPTGDTDAYASEGNVRIEPRLALDFSTDGGFVIAANIAFQPRATRRVLNFENTDAFKWGLGLEIPLVEDLALIGSLFGTVAVGADAGTSRTAPIEALGGVQWWFAKDWIGNIGAGSGLSNGVGAPDFRAFLSIGYTPRSGKDLDADKDGILDDVDKCPLDPEDKDGFEDEDGCPDIDNDKDGVLDVADGQADSTGYGKCRNDPEDKDGFQDEDGCPDPDNDADGILDTADGAVDGSGFGACRNDPEDKDLFQDDDGCPDPDNDGDKVLDVVDGDKDETGYGKCRDEPETVNEWKDEDGCRDIKPKAVLTETGIQILEKVYFDFNKATIQNRSYPLLDEVVRILTENPQVNLIRVEGHTDNVGNRAYNAGLSDRRAKSIQKYLVSKGVPANRLIAKGYGFDFPIDTNATQEGRDRNRRVEFNILEIDGKPVENQVIRTKTK